MLAYSVIHAFIHAPSVAAYASDEDEVIGDVSLVAANVAR